MNPSDEVVVVGFGDQARVVWDSIVTEGSQKRVSAFINVIDGKKHAPKWQGIPVFENLQSFITTQKHHGTLFVVALGQTDLRASLFETCIKYGMQPTTVVHPKAILCNLTAIGAG